MKNRCIVTLCVLSAVPVLVACSADFMTANGPLPSATATLLPPYIQTPQAAQADAQATLAFGEAQKAQMDITATALENERKALNLQLTQAAATQVYFAAQTESANNAATATAEYAQALQTEQARQTAEAAATAESARIATRNAAVQDTAEASVLQITQAAAAAEVKRIHDEQATQNLRTWAVRIFWGCVAVSAFGLALATLIQFRKVIITRLLVLRQGPKGRGKPLMMNLQKDGSVKVVDMTKSAAPVIDIPAIGEATLQGGLDDPQLQVYVAVQAAIADMLLALNTTTAEHRYPWEKDAPAGNGPQRKHDRSAVAAALLEQAARQRAQLPGQQAGTRQLLPSEIIDTDFRVATKEDKDVAHWISDVENKLLGE